MNGDKIKYAERIFDALGDVDDDMLDEALSFSPARTTGARTPLRIGVMRALTASAAMLAIVFALTVIRPLMRGFTVSEGSQSPDSLPPAGNADADADTAKYSLELLMLEQRSSDAWDSVDSAMLLPYLDGKAHVAWQYSGESAIYLSDPLTKDELSALVAALGEGDEVGASSPALECKVWLLFGDGRVVSPYLKPSQGNLGCSAFDYCAEIIPSGTLVSCISDILND